MPDVFHPVDLIRRKRDGLELSGAEINALIHAIVQSHQAEPEAEVARITGAQIIDSHISDSQITDSQIAAFLMAVFQRGLSPRELADLTEAMRRSGRTLTTPPGVTAVDKHSTGGVGDKTSLLLAPILAAASTPAHPIAVPMISGRSLGHTGGTLDKLESIPGFTTAIPLDCIPALLAANNAILIGQTPDLVPADRILYALRDHTATVESPALITASIMSKKLAEDLHGLVLDVKVGSGAFMPTYEASRHLAELLVQTGAAASTRTVALLTLMDQPLGRFAGNWLEVQECVEILQGHPHPLSSDLVDLTLTLAGWMLHLAAHPLASTPETGHVLAHHLLTSGQAYAAWLRIVAAQGGDTSVFDNPATHHQPKATRTLTASHTGYLASMDCREVGWAVQRLGAGRSHPGDPVSAHAGLEVHAKLGDHLQAGQSLFTLFSEDPDLLDQSYRTLKDALLFSDTPPNRTPLLHEVISSHQPN